MSTCRMDGFFPGKPAQVDAGERIPSTRERRDLRRAAVSSPFRATIRRRHHSGRTMTRPLDPGMSPELLLRESAWLRALARSLVADVHQAEDLAQDTLVAALEHPPQRRGTSLRAWLGTVARNFARMRARTQASAGRRERDAARHEALPSTRE